MLSTSILKKVSIGSGLLLIFLGSRYESNFGMTAGFFLVSGYFCIQGSEIIIHRQININQLDKGFAPARYLEWSDVARGILFIGLGVLIFGIAVSSYLGVAQVIFRYFVSHPGVVFFALSLVFLLYAVIRFIGDRNQPTKPQGGEWLALIFNQFLPAGFLILLAAVFLILGFVELLAPGLFDQLGGGYLEILFSNW
jgi:hypothetical protein